MSPALLSLIQTLLQATPQRVRETKLMLEFSQFDDAPSPVIPAAQREKVELLALALQMNALKQSRLLSFLQME